MKFLGMCSSQIVTQPAPCVSTQRLVLAINGNANAPVFPRAALGCLLCLFNST